MLSVVNHRFKSAISLENDVDVDSVSTRSTEAQHFAKRGCALWNNELVAKAAWKGYLSNAWDS